METFSALLAICAGNSPASGEFPAQRPVTRSFDVLFDLCLKKRLRKQSWGWWFETLSRPLWRHCNDCDITWHFIIFMTTWREREGVSTTRGSCSIYILCSKTWSSLVGVKDCLMCVNPVNVRLHWSVPMSFFASVSLTKKWMKADVMQSSWTLLKNWTRTQRRISVCTFNQPYRCRFWSNYGMFTAKP